MVQTLKIGDSNSLTWRLEVGLRSGIQDQNSKHISLLTSKLSFRYAYRYW